MNTGHVPEPAWTVGIDLASQPGETGVCVIDWQSAPARVEPVLDGKPTDEALLHLLRHDAAAKVAIDAPFGWPLAFVDVITTYRDRAEWLDLEPNDFRFRATDMHVAAQTGQTPLSVAMSDLAWPAMRCARLLCQTVADHGPLDRTGAGRCAEVYPAVALRRWGVIAPGTSVAEASYKGTKPGRRERRESMVDELLRRLDGAVEVDAATRARCVDDDDDLDALVSALVARAFVEGRTEPIPDNLRWAALREGWIHIPTADSLDELGR